MVAPRWVNNEVITTTKLNQISDEIDSKGSGGGVNTVAGRTGNILLTSNDIDVPASLAGPLPPAYGLSAADFGATGDGVSDDTAALQAWLNAGGGFMPAGTYLISATLDIGNGSSSALSTIQNVLLHGQGQAGAGAQEIGTTGIVGTATIKWAGTAGGTMLSIKGPLTNTVTNIQLDGNSTAGVGILDTHSVGGEMTNVVIRNVTTSFLQLRAYENVPYCYVSACSRVYRSVRGWDPVPGTGFVGLDVGNPTVTGSGAVLDVAGTTFINCNFSRPAGAGNDTLALRYCDNITFYRCFFYGPSKTVGNSIAVRVPTGAFGNRVYFPEQVLFYSCSPVGAYYTDPAWQINRNAALNRGLVFLPLMDGDNDSQIPTAAGWSGWTVGLIPFGNAAALARQQTQAQVTGTLASTNAFSCSVLSNTLAANRRIRMTANGTYFNNTGTAQTIIWYVGFGGQTVFNGSISVPSNAAAGSWLMTVDLGGYAGSASQQEAQSRLTLFAAGSVGGVANIVQSDTGAHTDVLTLDTTAENTLALSIILSNTALVVNTRSVVVESG
jgi:Pectate lyase superfamily protein